MAPGEERGGSSGGRSEEERGGSRGGRREEEFPQGRREGEADVRSGRRGGERGKRTRE